MKTNREFGWLRLAAGLLTVSFFGVLVLAGCGSDDLTQGLEPSQVITEALEKGREIESVTTEGVLETEQVDINYRAAIEFADGEALQQLIRFTIGTESADSLEFGFYKEEDELLVKYPEGEWISQSEAPQLRSTWEVVFSQTIATDPLAVLDHVNQSSQQLEFMEDEQTNGSSLKVIRASLQGSAWEVFGATVPRDVKQEQLDEIYLVLKFDKSDLRLMEYTANISLQEEPGSAPHIVVNYSFEDYNDTKIELPEALKAKLQR